MGSESGLRTMGSDYVAPAHKFSRVLKNLIDIFRQMRRTVVGGFVPVTRLLPIVAMMTIAEI
jgi:hypothetical protein